MVFIVIRHGGKYTRRGLFFAKTFSFVKFMIKMIK